MKTSYDIIICDLDGTLARSKSAIDSEMAGIIAGVLGAGKTFGVITGGMKSQIITQVVDQLPSDTPVDNLYIMPTSGAQMYCFKDGVVQKLYAYDFTLQEKQKVRKAFAKVLAMDLVEFPETLWGEQLEDRESQMSFSALGQQAPVEEKEKWDPDKVKRELLVTKLQPLIPEFYVKFGGLTTIDVTRHGIDKQFGINKFFEYTKLDKSDCLFIGDATEPGGNDYPVRKAGVDISTTSGPSETAEIILNKY